MLKTISQWAFTGGRPLSEVFAIAKARGFEAVELAVDETGPLPLDVTAVQCEAIKAQAADAGVQLSSLASGLGWKYPLTSSDASVRRRGIEITARSLEIAAMLGLDSLLVVPGGVAADFIEGFGVTPYDDAYVNVTASVKELAPVAESNGVHLLIENVWNMFFLSPLELKQFIDDIGSDYVGSYFDVGNVVATGYPEQWIKILGPRIKRVHFKDFKRSLGTLAGFCPLLEGDTDYAAVMNALREVGYDRSVTSEFFDVEDQLETISTAMDRILAL